MNDSVAAIIRGLSAGLLGCGIFSAQLAAQPAVPPPEERVIDLPPLIVLENKPGARWLYVASPGVEILSACSEETTVRFAEINRAQRELMRLVVPEEFLPVFAVPEIVVLFDQREGQTMPAELRERADAVEPAHISRPQGLSMEAVSDAARRFRIMPNLMVNGLDSIASCVDASRIGAYNWTTWENAFRLGEGYLRTMLAWRNPALPEWYVDGAVDLLRTAQVKDNGLLLWRADWAFRDEKGRPIVRAKRAKDDPRAHVMKPLVRIFEAAPERTVAELATMRANRALFVRWALDGRSPARRQALFELVRRSQSAPVTDEMIRACFGVSAERIWAQLEAYLPLATRRETLIPKLRRGSSDRLRVREATSSVVGRILGDWQRLAAIHLAALPDYREHYLEVARRAVARAEKAEESASELDVIAGLIEWEAGNSTAARERLEAAFGREGETIFRPAAGYALARLRFSQAVGDAAKTDGRLDLRQARFVVEPLIHVQETQPAMPALYLLAGEVWLRVEGPLADDVCEMMEAGARRFPNHPAVLLATARCCEKGGDADAASNWARAGLRYAQTETLRAALNAVISRAGPRP